MLWFTQKENEEENENTEREIINHEWWTEKKLTDLFFTHSSIRDENIGRSKRREGSFIFC